LRKAVFQRYGHNPAELDFHVVNVQALCN
jgi:hypothetical protein